MTGISSTKYVITPPSVLRTSERKDRTAPAIPFVTQFVTIGFAPVKDNDPRQNQSYVEFWQSSQTIMVLFEEFNVLFKNGKQIN
jgi:hypothetical protein